MGTISHFPQTVSPVERLWQRYIHIVGEARKNPLLVDDPAHNAARKEAHRQFTEAYQRGCGR